MRTTVAIDDQLLTSAKQRAQELGMTLGALIEQGLRAELTREGAYRSGPEVPVFRGGTGLRAGVDATSTRALLEALEQDQPWEALR